ncbi:DUF4870 domain-containing protein [Evansella sp. AB-rgal1]|uniref:DUF4870 domain-containing protein n=1 Tax=Evansella sp. AB-rgal1 TaxID=3242696 RepID=UPI00359E6B1E
MTKKYNQNMTGNHKTEVELSPRELPMNVKIVAMFNHMLALSVPLLNIIVTLLYWLFVRRQSTFADYSGKQSLNFQITFVLYLLGAILIWVAAGLIHQQIPSMVTIIIGNTAIISIFASLIVFWITVMIAGYKTVSGKKFKYPLAIQFLK